MRRPHSIGSKDSLASGKPTRTRAKPCLSYELIAGGSALVERDAIGEHAGHDDRLLPGWRPRAADPLLHGRQPAAHAGAGLQPRNRRAGVPVSGCHQPGQPGAGHMHNAKFRIVDNNHLSTEWEFYENGATEVHRERASTRAYDRRITMPQFMLLLYGDPSGWRRSSARRRCRRPSKSIWPGRKSRSPSTASGWPTIPGRVIRSERRQAARHRRPLQRDQGSARRLLHHRSGQLRRSRPAGARPSASRIRRHHRSAASLRIVSASGQNTVLLEHLFRHQAGRMVAHLTRLLGPAHLDLAEETVQEAMLRALQTWPYQGVPENPAAWLFRVAHNTAIDAVRRNRLLGEKTDALVAELSRSAAAAPADPRLRGTASRRRAAHDLHVLPSGDFAGCAASR